MPDSAERVPDSAEKVPDSAERVPDSAERVPDSAEKMPDNILKVPDSEQEQLVYKYVLENGSVTTNEVMELLNVKQRRARNILQSMVEEEWLRKQVQREVPFI